MSNLGLAFELPQEEMIDKHHISQFYFAKRKAEFLKLFKQIEARRMFSGNVNCTSNETIGKRRFKSLPGGLTGGLIGGLTGGLIGGLIGGLTGGRTRGGLTGLTGLILSAVKKDTEHKLAKSSSSKIMRL